jgi:hypothetical protein
MLIYINSQEKLKFQWMIIKNSQLENIEKLFTMILLCVKKNKEKNGNFYCLYKIITLMKI